MAKFLQRAFLLLALVTALALPAAASQAATGSVVPFQGFKPGTIVVKTQERRLYYVLRGRRALRFPVAVGRPGMQWSGVTRVGDKFVEPAWRAPRSINHGVLGPVIPGGSPRNPMGVAALTLHGTDYAIHGTNNPASIGRFISHGCIRMYNRDISKLFPLVSVGTPVIVEQ
jgi:lipoprotein-anchoring transpeptidase ErfK/SrfK